MKPIGNWKVSAQLADEAAEVGIYSGHIVDIAKKLSGIPCYTLYFTQVLEDPKEEFILPEERNTVRFVIEGLPKEIYHAYPEIRQAWIQNFIMQDEPQTLNWLIVHVSPSIKMEFI